MSEDQLLAKLEHIDATLEKLEKSAQNIIGHHFNNDYWRGRQDVLADIREQIGSLKEIIADGKSTETTDSSASTSTS